MRLAVFCSGFGSNFQALIDAVRKKMLRAEIAVLVSDDPKSFAVRRAVRHGIPVCLVSPKLFETRSAWERVIVSVLRSQGTDLVVLAGFMRILTPYFIRAYRDRVVNIHPSYLPAFKGAHAIRDAFEAGVNETGVTIHVVTEKVDDGPILAQIKVPVLKSDTLDSLEKKIHRAEHRIYPAAVQKFIDRSFPRKRESNLIPDKGFRG